MSLIDQLKSNELFSNTERVAALYMVNNIELSLNMTAEQIGEKSFTSGSTVSRVSIVLLCAAGASTSMLVSKLRQEAKNQGFECEINAYAFAAAEAGEKATNPDIVLLGPQIRYKLEKARELFPGKIVEPIDMRVYGTMNAKALLETVKGYLNHS